jgi:hypothetical protein
VRYWFTFDSFICPFSLLYSLIIILCTEASLYTPDIMLLISNKFWMGGPEGGESEGEKRGGQIRGGE